ncbi:uroporphyrinogen-III synthase [Camelliibacillus cellulosilyticus]|uniref:Uroporphyrinogen-III synthase n=2 Tax=Camelliibacillus cellulosilyticus TaxID=2174486 RepID=A0ABV9GIR0_9BACL
MGKRILITRARAASASMMARIEALGGEAVSVPVIAFKPLALSETEARLLKNAAAFDWVVVTSANGVRFLQKQLERLEARLDGVKVAAVGSKTAETLKKIGVTPSLIPDIYTANGLAEAFIKKDGASTLLLVLGKKARTTLEDRLAKAGFHPTRVDVYDTVKKEKSASLVQDAVQSSAIDVVTFASPTAVDFFLALADGLDLAPFWRRTKIACIGTVTAQHVKSKGLCPVIVPKTFTASALVDAIAEYYRRDFDV